MTDPLLVGGSDPLLGPGRSAVARPEPSSLADVLERVLDKGIVIAGDIEVDLVDVELLTIRLRLLVASVDRARELGIDWWEQDPMLSSRARDRRAPARRRDGYAEPRSEPRSEAGSERRQRPGDDRGDGRQAAGRWDDGGDGRD